MKKNMTIILLLATMTIWGGMWLSMQPQRAQAASFGAGIKKIQHLTGTLGPNDNIVTTDLVGGGTDFDSVATTEKTQLFMTYTSDNGANFAGQGTAVLTATNAITVYAGAGASVSVRWSLQIVEYY